MAPLAVERLMGEPVPGLAPLLRLQCPRHLGNLRAAGLAENGQQDDAAAGQASWFAQ
jgi:hypothetical protein